jgi:TPR repeat protein
MALKPGRYDILVESEGYQSARQWVVIDDHDVILDITLEKNPAAASQELKSDRGRSLFQQAMGLYTGTTGQTDLFKAHALFTQSANLGYAPATLWLAYCYQGAIPCKRDIKHAQRLAQQVFQEVLHLANEAAPEAALMLGVAYRDGLGVKKDDNQAVLWYRRAIELNHVDAMGDLVLCFRNNAQVARDVIQSSDK